MEISVVLILSFIVLVGLQISVPDGDVEKMADSPGLGCPWCPSPILKIFYGIIQLIGVAFIIIIVLYLTFTEKWWYFLIYLAGLPLSKIVSLLLQIFLVPVYKKYEFRVMYGGLRVKRLVGTLLIICGVLSCVIYYISF